jgi:6,7-dimethyl-8-ribityllumazine synthase
MAGEKIYEGHFRAEGKRFGIVFSRFNDLLGEKLLHGALDCLMRHGVEPSKVEIVKVPGSFEIPSAAKILASTGRFDAVVCLGVLIRGETPHFDLISREVTKGIAEVGRETGVPTIFGIVTAENLEQAMERVGTKHGNRGWDAALTAIEMADLTAQLKK